MFSTVYRTVVRKGESHLPEIDQAVCVLRCFSCVRLRDAMDHSWPGSSVHGILQARILEWVAMFSSGDLPDPGIEPAFLTSPGIGR